MTDVWRGLQPGSDARWRSRAVARGAAVPLVCCLGVATAFGAALCCSAAPSSADQVSSLEAEASALSKQMLLEQLQIDAYQQQRATDEATVSSDQAQLTATEAKIAATHQRIAKDMTDLRRAAVKAYVDGGTAAEGSANLFSGDPNQTASSVYDQVMSGDLNAAVSQLQTDRHALQSEMGAEQVLIVDAQKNANLATAALLAAQTTAQTLANQHAAVTGELATALAQQQAQQAAAAQAAAAQTSARAAPVAAPSTSGTPALPVLPPFLRCVIQVESGGDYRAVSPTGAYMGAFQFAQPTWNYAAKLAGKPTLVGVPPYDASPYDQDLLAIALYNADGEQPWYDPCRG